MKVTVQNLKPDFPAEGRVKGALVLRLLYLFALALSTSLSGCGGADPTATRGVTTFSIITTDSTTEALNLTVGVPMGSFSPFASTSGGAKPYTYSVVSGVLPAGLSLDQSTGTVTGTPTTVYPTADVVFSVQDANGQAASTTGTDSFTVTAASVSISATATTTAQALTVGQAMADFSPLTVSGGASPYTFSVTGTLPAGLSLNTTTGVVSGTPTAVSSATDLVFSVQDANGVIAITTSTVSFSVSATGPITATANSTAQNLTVGKAITSFSPLSVTGGTAPYSYYIKTGALPTGLSLNASTGVVSGTPSATYTTSDVTFFVMDAKYNVASTTSTVSFTASPSISATASTTAQNLMVGTTMASFTPLTASGGTTPYIYSISSGTLPSGLSFSTSTGAITGTPTATYSTANVVFKVQDANGVVANTSSTVSFSVSATGSAISAIANSFTGNLTVGTTMTSFSPLSAVGGTTPYTYSYTGTLPAGISFNTSTGVVSGTPTATSAASNVVFSVQDAVGVVASTSNTVSFSVSAAIAATANTTAQNLTTTVAMASFSPLTASGGTTPYTYYISSGALPTGLSLSSSTGAVTGTPTAAYTAANVVFAVKDANNSVAGTTSTVSFSVITHVTATAITTAQNLYVGLTMSPSFQPLTAAGGTPPYTYYVSSGTLPAGLALSATTGAISGKPTTVSAASNVVFSVMDANSVVATTTSTVSYTVNATTAAATNGTTTWASTSTTTTPPLVANGFVWWLPSPIAPATTTAKTTWSLASSYCAGTILGQTGWIQPTSTQIVTMLGSSNFYTGSATAKIVSVWSSTATWGGKYNGVTLSTAKTVTATSATNATTNGVMCIHN